MTRSKASKVEDVIDWAMAAFVWIALILFVVVTPLALLLSTP